MPSAGCRSVSGLIRTFKRKIRTNGGDESVIESIIRESEQDARLTDTRITDQQQLEQVVIRLLGHDSSGRLRSKPGLEERQTQMISGIRDKGMTISRRGVAMGAGDDDDGVLDEQMTTALPATSLLCCSSQ